MNRLTAQRAESTALDLFGWRLQGARRPGSPRRTAGETDLVQMEEDLTVKFNPGQPGQSVCSMKTKSELTLPSFGGGRRRFIEGIGRDMQTDVEPV